jgi:tetratricopeptide (TPR) repeat protein
VARRVRGKGATAPTTDKAIELALEADASGVAPTGLAQLLISRQVKLVGWQIASERWGVGLKALTAFAGVVAAAMLAALVWDATRTEALVVRPFSVPPELVERGITPEVAATRLLDGLATLQAQTVSNRAPGSYANDWGDEIQVQIPQTGVSIGELQDFLRGWLGRETSISGEIIRVSDGYAVTVRTGTEPGRQFSGPEAELGAMMQKASEAVYESTQPEGYAAWLRGRPGRSDEAAAVLERLTVSGTRERRAWAFAEWAAFAGTPAQRLDRARRAEALDPHLPLAQTMIASALGEMGHDEAKLDADRRAARLLQGRRSADYAPWAALLNLKAAQASIATALGDHGGAAALYASAAEPSPDQPPVACQQCSAGAWFQAANAEAANHDVAAARRYWLRGQSLQPGSAPLIEASLAISAAVARQEPQAVLAALEAPLMAAYAAQAGPTFEMMSLRPLRASSLADLGRVAEASADIAPTPLDCYACVIVRGEVHAAARRDAEADRAFARAVLLAPSLPQAHYGWGRAKMARGDLAGAATQFRLAQKAGPRWAEPLKGWGDVLRAQGNPGAAVRKYREAAERAPRWGGLHLAWGQALDEQGRRQAALDRYRAAGVLDLSAEDRLVLARRMRAPGETTP